MLAHRFCNLSPAEAAEVLAGCALLGQATRVKKAAFDLNKALEGAKSMGSSAWESAKAGDPLTLSLAGAAGGGLLGALAGHKKRRGSALNGAMLGALTGGGLSMAMKHFGTAEGDTPQTDEQNRIAAQEAADMSSKAVPAPAGAPGVAGPAVDTAATNHERALALKDLLGDRIGAGAYAASRGNIPQANSQIAPDQQGALIGGGIGAAGGLSLKHIVNRATVPGQMQAWEAKDFDIFGKGPGKGSSSSPGPSPATIMRDIHAGPGLRNPFSRKPIVPDFQNKLIFNKLKAQRSGGWKSLLGNAAWAAAPAAAGYLIGGQPNE